MSLNELFQRDRHLLLYSARVFNVARNVEELRAGIPLSAEARKPGASTATDAGRHGNRFHIGNSCWATKHTFNIITR